MPIVSELVTIELVFLLKKIQLHLLVFFIVESFIVSKKFVGGVRSRSSGVGRQESGVSGFVALSFLY